MYVMLYITFLNGNNDSQQQPAATATVAAAATAAVTTAAAATAVVIPQQMTCIQVYFRIHFLGLFSIFPLFFFLPIFLCY